MKTDGLTKLIPASQEGLEPGGGLYQEVGETSFTTTLTSLELRTQLSSVKHASFLPKVVVHDPQDFMISDLVVTSGAITVVRAASGTSGLTFTYTIIGYL